MAHLTALDEGRVCVLDYLDGNSIYSVISSSHIPLRHTNLCPALWAGQIRSVIVHESGLLQLWSCKYFGVHLKSFFGFLSPSISSGSN